MYQIANNILLFVENLLKLQNAIMTIIKLPLKILFSLNTE